MNLSRLPQTAERFGEQAPVTPDVERRKVVITRRWGTSARSCCRLPPSAGLLHPCTVSKPYCLRIDRREVGLDQWQRLVRPGEQ